MNARKPDVLELLQLCQQLSENGLDIAQDDRVRDRIADLYTLSEAVRLTRLRTLTSLSHGHAPGPEGSIVKLADTHRLQEMVAFALDLLGPEGVSYQSQEPLRNLFEDAFFYSAGLRIAGGTDEIQKNTLAERILGLPPDVRVDKDMAFKDIPTGVATDR